MLQTFLENQRAKQMLSNMLGMGRLPHTLLLEGPEGCGKRAFGRLIAAAILCQGEGPRPCGECPHCRKVLGDYHPDFIVCDPWQDAKVYSAERIRQLRREAALAPNEGRARVYLLAGAHLMSPQNQNIILKLIEEPPGSSYFLLTAPNRFLLLPTVRSRSVTVALEPLSMEACSGELQRRFPQASAQAADEAARFSGGCLGRAQDILNDLESCPEYEADLLVKALAKGEEYAALSLLAGLESAKKGRDRYLRVLEAAGQMVRRSL
ncbi:MAG: DNA polymerase III subunit, partial [Oscillospiraceae bacterium]|nr:DNA polymerase III subunit [Oscillospiraceae bacterium]